MTVFVKLRTLRSRLLSTRQQPGQALVEFALVVGLLLTIVFTGIALWPVLNAGDAVSMAAANGAHEAAITGGDVARTEQRVRENLAAASISGAPQARVSISCAGSCSRYSPVTVAIVTEVAPALDLPWLPASFTVDAAATRASEVDGGTGGSSGPPPVIPPLPPGPIGGSGPIGGGGGTAPIPGLPPVTEGGTP